MALAESVCPAGTRRPMPGRRRTHTLRTGGVIKTPLIIPSVSSRNVGRVDFDGEPESVASVALRISGHEITESVLVSAYDLHHGNLTQSEELLGGSPDTIFSQPELLMVDSGQYETRERTGYDDAAARPAQGWDQDSYAEVLSKLPDGNLAIVNFDHDHASFDDQVGAATELFAPHERFARVMLLKPLDDSGFLDIVAVTEKELGNTLLSRFETTARLRALLDQAEVPAPLHVFGGLDPLLTPIYFACGAEIVDGVGWLRYAYLDETAQYGESRALLDLDVDAQVMQRMMVTISRNLGYLRDLKRRLELLADDEEGSWQRFSERYGTKLEDAWRRVPKELRA